jgi:hypothetical protein
MTLYSITSFLCIKILVIVIEIMFHHFFRINYVFIWHNNGGNTYHFYEKLTFDILET